MAQLMRTNKLSAQHLMIITDRAIRLNNLGVALQTRFERIGSIEDLDRAIVTNEKAVETAPDGHPNRAMYLNNFGNALQIRFERTGSMDDLGHAIMANKQAVESNPVDHPTSLIYLNNLSTSLYIRFRRTGSMDDLNRAIVTNEQAVESTPHDHPGRATMSQQFRDRSAESIPEDRVDGRSRSCDCDTRASRRIDPKRSHPIVRVG